MARHPRDLFIDKGDFIIVKIGAEKSSVEAVF